mmetsp:Transcript_30017/g.80625  ORF Transcript_30017/g.80625 Transcript_30017/m.80625 type:complete len:94 (+) Transcript_30017:1-282(+)
MAALRPPKPRSKAAKGGSVYGGGSSMSSKEDGVHALQPPRTPQGAYAHDQYGFPRDFGDRRMDSGLSGAYGSGNRLTASYSHSQYGAKGAKRF